MVLTRVRGHFGHFSLSRFPLKVSANFLFKVHFNLFILFDSNCSVSRHSVWIVYNFFLVHFNSKSSEECKFVDKPLWWIESSASMFGE